MGKKPRKPKRVSFELVERDSVIGHPMYELLDAIVTAHHDEIRHARIALAWCTSWQPDDVDESIVVPRFRSGEKSPLAGYLTETTA